VLNQYVYDVLSRRHKGDSWEAHRAVDAQAQAHIGQQMMMQMLDVHWMHLLVVLLMMVDPMTAAVVVDVVLHSRMPVLAAAADTKMVEQWMDDVNVVATVCECHHIHVLVLVHDSMVVVSGSRGSVLVAGDGQHH
jgi:hypothetical protein